MTSPSFATIILNYNRPGNIARIVAAVHEAAPEHPIFLLDQAPTDALRFWVELPWDRLWYRRPLTNGRAGARIALAASLPFDHYLAIDDDVFLTPEQIRSLIALHLGEPERAHGVVGQRLERQGQGVRVTKGLVSQDAAVSILNMVYLFSRRQAQRAMENAAGIGFSQWSDVRYGDDILLSCAADKQPLCHDVGMIEICPSWNDSSIAVCREGDFFSTRAEMIKALVQLGGLKVES